MSNVSSLSFKNVFGLNKQCKPNIMFAHEEFVIFPAGNTLVSHNINSRQQKVFPSSEDISYGVSAIAYSQGKPHVAYANNSVQPSIRVFDIHSFAPVDFPTIGSDFGSTGLVSLSFSSDGQYLLGHGGHPGWNLVVWSIEMSKYKFIDHVRTSDDDTPVTQCSFSPGKDPQIAVTGDNILKIYKIENNKLQDVIFAVPKLGNIFCHLWLSENTLLCTNSSGDILNVTSNPPYNVFGKCEHRDSAFVSLCRFKKGFLAGSAGGYLTCFLPSSEHNGLFDPIWQVRLFNDELPISVHTISVDPSEDNAVVTLINNRVLLISLSNGDILLNNEDKPVIMPFHDGAIFSCSLAYRKPLVATCGADKTVRVWNYLDNSLEIVHEYQESVYCVSFHPDGLSLLIGFGDKLRLCGVFFDDIRVIHEFQIRGCRCTKFSNGGHLFAAVNGSKIQVYSSLTFQLINTFQRHSATVHSLIWGESDTVIASVGNDGAMYIHRQESTNRDENHTASQIQYYSLTSAPDFSSIYICGSDSSVKEIQNGVPVHKDQFSQPHTQLVMSNNGQMLFSGTKDGKVYSFSLPIGGDKFQLACHTSPITSIAISFDDSLLFTTGEDGVLCIFTIRDKDNRVHSLERSFFSEEVMIVRGDLDEKANELRRFEADLADLEINFKHEKERHEIAFKSEQASLIEMSKKEKEKWHTKIENLKKNKDEVEMNHKAKEAERIQYWQKQISEQEDSNIRMIERVNEEKKKLEETKRLIEDTGKSQLKLINEKFQHNIESIKQNNKLQLEASITNLKSADEKYVETTKEIQLMKELILKEKQDAIIETEKKFKSNHDENQRTTATFMENIAMAEKDWKTYQKEDLQNQDEISRFTSILKSLDEEEKKLRNEYSQTESEKKQKDAIIKDRENKISTVKKENQELEKYHAVLNHREQMLRNQTGPLEDEINDIESNISSLDRDLESAHKRTSEQNEMIQDMHNKLKSVIELERNQTHRLMTARSYFEQSKHDLHEVIQLFHAKDSLKKSFESFCSKYIKDERIEDIQLDQYVEEEHKRQKSTLQKQLKELRHQHTRDNQFQVKEQAKLLSQNASLIEELQRLRQENKSLNSTVALSKKSPGSTTSLLPATEAQRLIEEYKKQITKLELQLSAYNEPRPTT